MSVITEVTLDHPNRTNVTYREDSAAAAAYGLTKVFGIPSKPGELYVTNAAMDALSPNGRQPARIRVTLEPIFE